MFHVNSRHAKDAGSRTDARWSVRLISNREVRVMLTALMLTGCLSIASSASAQTGVKPPEAGQSTDCSAACMSTKETCVAAGSEEYCSYEAKQCEKSCEKK
jgi:hypothetical protein